MFVNLSRDAAVTRMEQAHTRMEQLGGKHRMSKSDETEFDQLHEEFEELRDHVEQAFD